MFTNAFIALVAYLCFLSMRKWCASWVIAIVAMFIVNIQAAGKISGVLQVAERMGLPLDSWKVTDRITTIAEDILVNSGIILVVIIFCHFRQKKKSKKLSENKE